MSIYKVNEETLKYVEEKESMYKKYAKNALKLADSIDDNSLPEFIWHIQLQTFENDMYILKFDIAANHPELTPVFKIRAKYHDYWKYNEAMIVYEEYMAYIKDAKRNLQQFGNLVGSAGIYIPPKPSLMGKKNKNISRIPRSRIYVTDAEFNEYDFDSLKPEGFASENIVFIEDDPDYHGIKYDKKQAAVDRVKNGKKGRDLDAGSLEAIIQWINWFSVNPTIAIDYVENDKNMFNLQTLYQEYFADNDDDDKVEEALAERIKETVKRNNTRGSLISIEDGDLLSFAALWAYFAEFGYLIQADLNSLEMSKRSRRAFSSDMSLKFESFNGITNIISPEEYLEMSKEDRKTYIKTKKMLLKGQLKKLSKKYKLSNDDYDKYNLGYFKKNKRNQILSENMKMLQIRADEINRNAYNDNNDAEMNRLNDTILSSYNSAYEDDDVIDYFIDE